MLNLHRKILLLKTRFWNKLVFFPSVRIKKLNKKIKELETQIKKKEVSEAREAINKILKLQQRSSTFKKLVKKEYLAWKIYTRQKKISENGSRCEKCGTGKRKLTLDHIIPQSFLKSLGMNPEHDFNEDNIQVLCELCNAAKGNSFDFTNPKTKYLLLDYLKVLPPEPNPFKKKKEESAGGFPQLFIENIQ